VEVGWASRRGKLQISLEGHFTWAGSGTALKFKVLPVSLEAVPLRTIKKPYGL
jgi:hypothetical protein